MTCPVTAIFVTYNSEDTVGQALDAVQESHEAGLLEAVVVDNASSDGTCEIVTQGYPSVRLIRSETNLGYGKGLNLGFEGVESPYVIFMNPDAVLPRNAVETLLAFMESHPEAGLAAPSTVREDGNYQEVGGLVSPWTFVRNAAGIGEGPAGKRPLLPGTKPTQTDWVCGAIMFLRTRAVRETGGMDPRFFLYFEETDLCVRLVKAGYSIWAVGEAVAGHASGASARKVQPGLKGGGCLHEHFYPSRFYYMVKHFGWPAALFAESAEIVLMAARDVARAVVRKTPRHELRARLRAPMFRMPPRPDVEQR